MNFSSSMRNWTFFTSAVLLGALCLLWTAIENGYPLVSFDTGNYIRRSFSLELTGSRTIFYSLFIRATRIADSLWVVVTIQALWTSWLLARNTVCLFPRGCGRSFIALGIVVATVACTGIARYVGWVMPDIFTSWLFLGGLLFYLSSHWMDRVMASISIGLAILVHNSHFALSVIVLALLYAVGILFRSRLSASFWKILRDLTVLYVLVVAISCLVNFSKDGTFVPVRGGPTFVINRFIHSGVLIKTLDRYCGEKKWKFCNHKELFRSKTGTVSWFLWGADSPINELGGWEQAGGEQSEVIGYAFRCCSWFILTTTVDDFVRQLVMFNSDGSLRSFEERYSVYGGIRDRYPNELESFKQSKLQSGSQLRVLILPFSERWVYLAFFLGSLVLMTVCFRKGKWHLGWILVAVLVFIASNAFVVTLGNTPHHRFQSRVIWLLAYCFFLALFSFKGSGFEQQEEYRIGRR